MWCILANKFQQQQHECVFIVWSPVIWIFSQFDQLDTLEGFAPPLVENSLCSRQKTRQEQTKLVWSGPAQRAEIYTKESLREEATVENLWIVQKQCSSLFSLFSTSSISGLLFSWFRSQLRESNIGQGLEILDLFDVKFVHFSFRLRCRSSAQAGKDSLPDSCLCNCTKLPAASFSRLTDNEISIFGGLVLGCI